MMTKSYVKIVQDKHTNLILDPLYVSIHADGSMPQETNDTIEVGNSVHMYSMKSEDIDYVEVSLDILNMLFEQIVNVSFKVRCPEYDKGRLSIEGNVDLTYMDGGSCE